MALIPALSEKAKEEIERNVPYELRALDSIEAFQDLFDLEKHPITWEQLFEFCTTQNKHYVDTKCFDDGSKYIRAFIYFPPDNEGYSECDYQHLGIENTASEILVALSKSLGIDVIIIIGDIHGWWEKPQTY